MRREWALLDANGEVLNMASTVSADGPQFEPATNQPGWKWVHVEEVPLSTLERYRYWSERP